jgi:3-deoxy-manno-octulosonate cytidylyltransferase (CMP-KDO synthetase)
MIGWVYRAALACAQFDQVLIAADSQEVADYAASQGWQSIMTSTALASGTDRVQAVAGIVDADIYANLQGDEPLLRPEHIAALLRPFASRLHPAAVSTVATPCPPDQVGNPNAVKVVTANDGRALYFSRAAIPFPRDGGGAAGVFRKHLGIYAYRKEALRRFASLAPSTLESTERLEQLRLLENGIDIYVEETPFDTIGVDTEEDLAAAEEELLKRSRQ